MSFKLSGRLAVLVLMMALCASDATVVHRYVSREFNHRPMAAESRYLAGFGPDINGVIRHFHPAPMEIRHTRVISPVPIPMIHTSSSPVMTLLSNNRSASVGDSHTGCPARCAQNVWSEIEVPLSSYIAGVEGLTSSIQELDEAVQQMQPSQFTSCDETRFAPTTTQSPLPSTFSEPSSTVTTWEPSSTAPSWEPSSTMTRAEASSTVASSESSPVATSSEASSTTASLEVSSIATSWEPSSTMASSELSSTTTTFASASAPVEPVVVLHRRSLDGKAAKIELIKSKISKLKDKVARLVAELKSLLPHRYHQPAAVAHREGAGVTMDAPSRVVAGVTAPSSAMFGLPQGVPASSRGQFNPPLSPLASNTVV